jgi:hypothetical protein
VGGVRWTLAQAMKLWLAIFTALLPAHPGRLGHRQNSSPQILFLIFRQTLNASLMFVRVSCPHQHMK